MAGDPRLEMSRREGGRTVAATWSPRARLLFLVGAVIVSWGAFVLLILPLI